MRASPWAMVCGEWSVSKMLVHGEAGYLLWRKVDKRSEILGSFTTAKAAMARADELDPPQPAPQAALFDEAPMPTAMPYWMEEAA